MTPLPSTGDVTPVKLFALPTGWLCHPDRWLFEDGDTDQVNAIQQYPDYSFLIRHPSGQNVLFDLGLRKDLENVPRVIHGSFPIVNPQVPEDVVDLLSKGPVSPSSIHTVVFSHLHFDHVGDSTKFPDATLVAGPGGKAASAPGFPVNPGSPFESAPIQHAHYRELSFENDKWVPLGPFSRAHDFFGDGSFWLVDTPGHMPGHLGGLALSGPDEWVFMGGDCCHHRSLLVGSRPMSVTVGPAGLPCFHKDPDTAAQTIAKIRELETSSPVLVALAHDSYLVGRMPEYPQSINNWRTSAWKKDLDSVLAQDYGVRE
ncbi:hypothetical protein RBB50_010451 [Rhinocladiella similis]